MMVLGMLLLSRVHVEGVVRASVGVDGFDYEARGVWVRQCGVGH